MVYNELSNQDIFLCCHGAEQVNSGWPAPWVLRKAIVDVRMSSCEKKQSWWGSNGILGFLLMLFRTSQSGHNVSPWSVHDCITITPYCVIIVCFYCSCFMTHFGLLLANTMIHDFYSFDDSWPLLWPTIDLFLLSVRPTFSNDIHFLYQQDSIFGLIVGFLQSFRDRKSVV